MANSKMATRKAFGNALVEYGQNPAVVVLDADLSKSTNSFAFSQKYPKRFFQMGIAEANMIGVASGFALCGFTPFACSFACFITGRFDQIKMSVAYSGAPVVIVGTHAGVGIGEDGYSQQGLEDLALMRSLPTMEVFQPGDDIETAAMVKYLISSGKPSYLRLTRQDVVRVHEEDYRFVPGVFPKIKDGKAITIFASGGVLQHALEAAHKAPNLDIAVYNASSIKPVDEQAIFSAAKTSKLLVSVEDHSIIGGLGGAIAETLSQKANTPGLLRLGVKDEFGESGTPEALYEKHGLDAAGILKSIETWLKNNN